MTFETLAGVEIGRVGGEHQLKNYRRLVQPSFSTSVSQWCGGYENNIQTGLVSLD
jgi:hypothetical protein